MFRRRKQMSVLSAIRSVIWPERGFRRLFSYIFQRIIRLPGTPASIAIGMASGVAASFTPLLGLHFLIGALLAMLLRGNVLASAIGTFFGNPWTFVPIWLLSYRVGCGTLQRLGYTDSSSTLSVDQLLSIMGDVARFLSFSGSVSWAEVKTSLEQVFVPLLIGGTILGVIAWIIVFVITFWAVKIWRRHRLKKLGRAAQQRLSKQAKH